MRLLGLFHYCTVSMVRNHTWVISTSLLFKLQSSTHDYVIIHEWFALLIGVITMCMNYGKLSHLHFGEWTWMNTNGSGSPKYVLHVILSLKWCLLVILKKGSHVEGLVGWNFNNKELQEKFNIRKRFHDMMSCAFNETNVSYYHAWIECFKSNRKELITRGHTNL